MGNVLRNYSKALYTHGRPCALSWSWQLLTNFPIHWIEKVMAAVCTSIITLKLTPSVIIWPGARPAVHRHFHYRFWISVNGNIRKKETKHAILTSIVGSASIIAPPSLSGSAWMRLLSRAVEFPILTSVRLTTNYPDIFLSKINYVISKDMRKDKLFIATFGHVGDQVRYD